MTDQMPDDQFDRAIRDFLAWQADDVTDGPTATVIASRISSRVAPRTFESRVSPQVVWIVLAGLLLAALVGTFVVGGLLRTNNGPLVVLPTAPPTAVVSPAVHAPAVPTPAPTRRPSQEGVTSGNAATSIGQVSWTRVEGDATEIPGGDIFEIPSGFGAIDIGPDGTTRFWKSTDGVTWAITPAPVPATEQIRHALTAGEHWIWSTGELRLWRSSDFATWTEVDLSQFEPLVVADVTWALSSIGPTTAGTTTIFPWYETWSIALDELLGIELEPGEGISVPNTPRHDPVLGEVRDVIRTPPGEFRDRGVKVGSIRVGLDGSIVTITDAERDVVIATIDADLLGLPPATVAANINLDGSVGALRGGAVISNGNARELTYPPLATPPLPDRAPADGFIDLFPLDGRFVGLTEDLEAPGGPRLVWTSTNGNDWESLGRQQMPVASGASASFYPILRHPDGDPGRSLMAPVFIDAEDSQQRLELWSSLDGVTWSQVGLVNTPGGPVGLSFAPSAGYLAMGDDGMVRVSPTGAEWSLVDGLTGVGATVFESGGSGSHAVAQDAVFILEVPYAGNRVMWVLTVEAD